MNARRPRHYSVLEVLNFAEVGLIFEFYSTKETNFLIEKLSKCTSKNVILTNDSKYHPTYANAILLKEYEAKKSRYQFFIAPQNFHSILPILDAVSTELTESAELNYDTGLKMSLSFNHRHLQTLSTISTMNPTKLILKFDESYVYSRFPEQQNSPYALSIKKIAPINTYINESEIEKNIDYLITLPEAEYYGISFSNYTQGILECNYIGGKEYANKSKQIKEILEYFIIKTYQSLNEEEYDDFERYEIKKLVKNFDKIQMAYWDPMIFLNEYKNLKVYVNLQTSEQILKSYWNTIRKPIFEMIINGNLTEGTINYDTDNGLFQLKQAKISCNLLKNMDFIDCEITESLLENCAFIGCSLSKSRIYNSKFINGNKVSLSYIKQASINKANEVKNCYIVNNEEIINCDIKESVIKFATPGKDLKLDENSIMIILEMPLPKKTDALEIKEIRDYSWIKAMRKTEDTGYGNAYNRNKYLKNNNEND